MTHMPIYTETLSTTTAVDVPSVSELPTEIEAKDPNDATSTRYRCNRAHSSRDAFPRSMWTETAREQYTVQRPVQILLHTTRKSIEDDSVHHNQSTVVHV